MGVSARGADPFPGDTPQRRRESAVVEKGCEGRTGFEKTLDLYLREAEWGEPVNRKNEKS